MPHLIAFTQENIYHRHPCVSRTLPEGVSARLESRDQASAADMRVVNTASTDAFSELFAPVHMEALRLKTPQEDPVSYNAMMDFRRLHNMDEPSDIMEAAPDPGFAPQASKPMYYPMHAPSGIRGPDVPPTTQLALLLDAHLRSKMAAVEEHPIKRQLEWTRIGEKMCLTFKKQVARVAKVFRCGPGDKLPQEPLQQAPDNGCVHSGARNELPQEPLQQASENECVSVLYQRTWLPDLTHTYQTDAARRATLKWLENIVFEPSAEEIDAMWAHNDADWDALSDATDDSCSDSSDNVVVNRSAEEIDAMWAHNDPDWDALSDATDDNRSVSSDDSSSDSSDDSSSEPFDNGCSESSDEEVVFGNIEDLASGSLLQNLGDYIEGLPDWLDLWSALRVEAANTRAAAGEDSNIAEEGAASSPSSSESRSDSSYTAEAIFSDSSSSAGKVTPMSSTLGGSESESSDDSGDSYDADDSSSGLLSSYASWGSE